MDDVTTPMGFWGEDAEKLAARLDARNVLVIPLGLYRVLVFDGGFWTIFKIDVRVQRSINLVVYPSSMVRITGGWEILEDGESLVVKGSIPLTFSW